MEAAVIGAGIMGQGIALALAKNNYNVCLIDTDLVQLNRALESIKKKLERESRERSGGVETFERIRASGDLATNVAKAQLVVEAITENMSAKKQLFESLGRLCQVDTLIASNTSSLSITELAASYPWPERVIGLHFFNPVDRTQLVEVVKTDFTSDRTLGEAKEIVRSLGKSAIVCPDTPGFVVNRIARMFYAEAELIVEAGVNPEIIDTSICLATGFPMGPLELVDLIGLDVHLATSEAVYEELKRSRYRPIPVVRQMVRSGRLGRKTNRGFYDYREKADGAIRPVLPSIREEAGEISSVLAVGGDRSVGRIARTLREAGVSEVVIGNVRALEDRTQWDVIVCEDVKALDGVVKLSRHSSEDPHMLFVLTSCLVSPTRLMKSYGLPAAVTVHYPLPFLKEDFVEVCIPDSVPGWARAKCRRLLDLLGVKYTLVPDLPGLIVCRVISQVVNEAFNLIEYGHLDEKTVDEAMKLGMNWPCGPFEIANEWGAGQLVFTLEMLESSCGDERYKPSWMLRRETDAFCN